MTEKQSASQEIIDRYLADRLDEAERAMVETRIVRDEDFRNEVMLTDALRDGLRQLDAQGQIAPLLQTRTKMRERAPLAIAAAALACAIGVATFLVTRPLDDSSQILATQTLHFVMTRSGDARPDVTWKKPPEPTRIEMRLDVGVEPAAQYSVSVARLSDGVTGRVFETLAARTREGDVAIDVDATLLRPGDYVILLVPQGPDGMQSVARYTLRVSD